MRALRCDKGAPGLSPARIAESRFLLAHWTSELCLRKSKREPPARQGLANGTWQPEDASLAISVGREAEQIQHLPLHRRQFGDHHLRLAIADLQDVSLHRLK